MCIPIAKRQWSPALAEACGVSLNILPPLLEAPALAGHMTSEAARDPRIVGVTAAMPSGTGLDIMGKRFPDRVFDVGIAEQHAVTFSAGMAASGRA